MAIRTPESLKLCSFDAASSVDQTLQAQNVPIKHGDVIKAIAGSGRKPAFTSQRSNNSTVVFRCNEGMAEYKARFGG